MLDNFEKERNRKIIDIVRRAIDDDKVRREQFKIGDQYSFIPEKLLSILKRLEDNLDYSEEVITTRPAWYRDIADDEQVIFIYLYNAHGKDKHVWERLLSTKALNEHSFSRPTFLNRADVEKILHNRGDSPTHAFIGVAVKKKDIITSPASADLAGGQRIRLAENSLDAGNVIEFFHNGKTYYRDHRGRLVLKEGAELTS